MMPEYKYEGWIGVDLDGTLAHVDDSKRWDINTIGDPIPAMMEKVIKLLKEGRYEVRIFTARVGTGAGLSPTSGLIDTLEFAAAQKEMIQDWTEEHFGVRLEVTAQKDWRMIEIWDDRAKQVAKNRGRFIEDLWKDLIRFMFGQIGGELFDVE